MKLKDVINLPAFEDLPFEYLTFPAGYSFVTPYILVYGTLRVGQSNYDNFKLDVHSQHLGTFCLRGWQLSGICATPTGDPQDYLVVDALKIVPGKSAHQTMGVYEIMYQLDTLEGVHANAYTQTIVPILYKEEGKDAKKVFAKLYMGFNYETTGKRAERNPNGDYLRKSEEIPSSDLYPMLTLAE